MSFQIIVKDPRMKRIANLDAHDLDRVAGAVILACQHYFKKERGDTGSRVILLVEPKPPTPVEIKHITEQAWETFKILYCEKQWVLSKCLDNLPEICYRKITTPGTWDIYPSEEKNTWTSTAEDQALKEKVDERSTTEFERLVGEALPDDRQHNSESREGIHIPRPD